MIIVKKYIIVGKENVASVILIAKYGGVWVGLWKGMIQMLESFKGFRASSRTLQAFTPPLILIFI